GVAVRIAGKPGADAAGGQSSTLALIDPVTAGAFDPAGNLLAFSGQRLGRVDGVTWAATTLARWPVPVFGGGGVPVDQASFQAPPAIVFADRDLYIADGNGTVRRVVNLGSTTPHAPLSVVALSGDGGLADLEQKLADPVAVAVENGPAQVPGLAV